MVINFGWVLSCLTARTNGAASGRSGAYTLICAVLAIFISGQAQAAVVPLLCSGSLATPAILGTSDAGADDPLVGHDSNNDGVVACFFDVHSSAVGQNTASWDFSSTTATVAIYDSNSTTESTHTVHTFVDIPATTTLTVLMGGSKADGSGTDSEREANLKVTGGMGDSGGTALGGSVIIQGTANENTGAAQGSTAAHHLETADLVHLNTLQVVGGAGGGAEAGAPLFYKGGDASGDEIKLQTFTLTGGAGGSQAGGAADATLTGTLTDCTNCDGVADGAGTGIVVISGIGAAAAGGATKLTITEATTISGNVSVSSAAAAAATSGTAELETTGNFAAGDITLLAGTPSAAAVSGAVDLDANGTLTATGLVATAATGNSGSGAGGGGDVTIDVAAAKAATFTGAVTLSGGAAGASTDDAGDAGDLIAAFNNTFVATDQILTLNGGEGNTGVSASSDGGNSTATFFKNITAESIVLNDGEDQGTSTGGLATINFTPATGTYTITGTIDGGTAGEGTFVSAPGTGTANITFANDVGGTAKLKVLTLTGGNFQSDYDMKAVSATTINMTDGGTAGVITALIDGDITATTIIFTDADNGDDVLLTLDGTVAQTVTAAFEPNGTEADGQGTLTISNEAGVTFTGMVGQSASDDLELVTTTGSATKATFNAAVHAHRLTTADTSIMQFDVNGNTSNTLTFAANTKVIVGSGVVAGETLFTIDAAIAGSLAGTVDLDLPAAFTSGTITIFSGNSGGTDASQFKTFDTALVDYTVAIDGSNVTAVATTRSAADAAVQLKNTPSVARATLKAQLAVAGVTADANAYHDMVVAADQANLQRFADQVAAQEDAMSGLVAVASGFSRWTTSGAYTRLAALRSGDMYRNNIAGFAAGDGKMSNHVWIRPFGSSVDQKKRDNADGYDADSFGVVGGFDLSTEYFGLDNFRLGAAFSYVNNKIDGDGAGNQQTDSNGWGANIYGDYSDDDFYIQFIGGHGWFKNDHTRTINTGGFNRTASAAYNSTQWSASVDGGMPFNVEDVVYVTPSLGFSYVRVDANKYTETGAGNLNQKVDPGPTDVTLGLLGLRFHDNYGESGSRFTPELRASVQYDFSGDRAEATTTFTGGGTAFKSEGAKPKRLGVNVGAGLAFELGHTTTLSMNYDATLKSKYVSHTAAVEFKASFE